jgi:hypothetical protein
MIFCPHSEIGNLLCGIFKARARGGLFRFLAFLFCFKKRERFPAESQVFFLRFEDIKTRFVRGTILETIELTGASHAPQRLRALINPLF